MDGRCGSGANASGGAAPAALPANADSASGATAAIEAKTNSGEPMVNRRASSITPAATTRPMIGPSAGAPEKTVWVRALPARNHATTNMMAVAATS